MYRTRPKLVVYIRSLMQSISLKCKHQVHHFLLVATERSEWREEIRRVEHGESDTSNGKHPKAS